MDDDHDQPHDHDPEELARHAAHVILDGLIAMGEGTATDGGEESEGMQLAFERMLEIGAIELALDEETDELELDISGLMTGVLLVVRRLVDDLAQRDGVEVDDVVARVRGEIDAP